MLVADAKQFAGLRIARERVGLLVGILNAIFARMPANATRAGNDAALRAAGRRAIALGDAGKITHAACSVLVARSRASRSSRSTWILMLLSTAACASRKISTPGRIAATLSPADSAGIFANGGLVPGPASR